MEESKKARKQGGVEERKTRKGHKIEGDELASKWTNEPFAVSAPLYILLLSSISVPLSQLCLSFQSPSHSSISGCLRVYACMSLQLLRPICLNHYLNCGIKSCKWAFSLGSVWAKERSNLIFFDEFDVLIHFIGVIILIYFRLEWHKLW